MSPHNDFSARAGNGLMKHLRSALALLLLIMAVPPALAEIAASSYTVVRIGEVQSVDYATRTAVISGYRYAFSGVRGYDTPAVRMLNSEAGAFELLEPGMRVRVLYRLSERARIVVELQQVSRSTPLGIPADQ
jgi:hypothetical protein